MTPFNATGSAQFTTGGQPRVFIHLYYLRRQEDAVTYEKRLAANLEITDYVTEHTINAQALASDYATEFVKCLVQSNAANSTNSSARFCSLSRPIEANQSRLLCLAFLVAILSRTIHLEYTFTLL